MKKQHRADCFWNFLAWQYWEGSLIVSANPVTTMGMYSSFPDLQMMANDSYLPSAVYKFPPECPICHLCGFCEYSQIPFNKNGWG